MARVLVVRLSAFGDVAMLVPVLFSVAARYPQDRFTVLTRKAFAPLFENLGFNISALTFDPNRRHKGAIGLVKLLSSISRYRFTHVADVHDVLRSRIIRNYMHLFGKKVAYIDKGRAEKRSMIISKKTYPPLKHASKRYMDVFDDLGFPAEMIFTNFFEFRERSLYPLRTIVNEKMGQWIGVAPFSKHREKIYPLDKMENIVSELSKRASTTVFLFGSGQEEQKIMQNWANRYENVINVSGKVNLINELLLISYLDVMVSMDSANLHLASLVQVPVVSVWGATHPSLGFSGFNQDPQNNVQIDIECRPCSVYGEIPCSRGDYACLTGISEDIVLEHIESVLIKTEKLDQ